MNARGIAANMNERQGTLPDVPGERHLNAFIDEAGVRSASAKSSDHFIMTGSSSRMPTQPRRPPS